MPSPKALKILLCVFAKENSTYIGALNITTDQGIERVWFEADVSETPVAFRCDRLPECHLSLHRFLLVERLEDALRQAEEETDECVLHAIATLTKAKVRIAFLDKNDVSAETLALIQHHDNLEARLAEHAPLLIY